MVDFPDINIDTSSCKIGFIGAGNMSMAIIKGLIEHGEVDASRICVSAPSNQNLPKFEQLGCTTTNDNYSLVYNFKCSIIFLCVKPHHITPEAHIFKLVTVKHPLIIMSAVAGMTLEALYENCFTKGIKYENCCIYRLMPNLACQVGKGVCGISRILPSEQTLDTCIKNFLDRIFSCHFLPEHQLDQLTALSGSGIAFAFTFIQAMADGGVKIGLPRELAVTIATETISGACAMVSNTKKHPIELRDAVCSPAGTTIYGIHALQKAKFSSAVIDSVTSSYSRCIELKK